MNWRRYIHLILACYIAWKTSSRTPVFKIALVKIINDMNGGSLFGDNEYLLVLSKLVAEEKLLKSDLLRLIKAREFGAPKALCQS